MSTPTLMYIGPDRPFGLPLRHNTLLRGAPEEAFPALGALLAKHEDLRTLFVPVEDLATARMLLTNEREGYMHIWRHGREEAERYANENKSKYIRFQSFWPSIMDGLWHDEGLSQMLEECTCRARSNG